VNILKNTNARDLICLIASVLLGLNLLVAGVGKLVGHGEFFGALEAELMFLPEVLHAFLGWAMPLVEIIIGGSLILGVYRKLVAALSLPVVSGFIFVDVKMWLIGLAYFECPCRVTTLFGKVTVMQALGIDAVMVLLALVILFTSPRWLGKPKWLKKENINQYE